jgi:hypothetical protein
MKGLEYAVAAYVLMAVPAAERETFPVYLCPLHPDEQATAPRRCSICGRELVLRTLASSYSCPMHPAVDEQRDGTCPYCRMKLVRTTREAQWFCPSRPDVFFPTAGTCPDGQPMEMRTIAMAHGDHNPRHGGILFMAPNGYHHLEGALQENGEFRLFLYDDFTRPLPVGGFEARAGESAMTPAEDGSFLSAPVARSADPAEVVVLLRFPGETAEARFDFVFSKSARATDPALPADEFRIPESAEEIYREILRRNERIQDLIQKGSWQNLYIPALEAKDLVLALVEREGERVEAPARKLVRAAWLLDSHGDLGNRLEVEAAFRLFEEAVGDLAEVHAN